MCEKKHLSSLHAKVRRHFERRFGASLEHGKAHSDAHQGWNRRHFLKMTGLAALGSAFMFGQLPVASAAGSPLLSALSASESGDRVLVLVRLKGGNDGLNTLILRGNDEYYNIRPSIAVPESGLWALDAEHGMPNALLDLQPFWEEGKMKIVHNVGYPEANYSHFRSSDIWDSASGSNEVIGTGWIGRWLDQDLPGFSTAPPVVPPALQIGGETDLLFRAAAGSMALSINNPTEFYQLAQSGELHDASLLSASLPNEVELAYVQGLANSAFRYAETIRSAYNGAVNQATYPDNYLAEQLAIVARLIKGNLGTKVFMASIDGFDTHAEQNPQHFKLLQALGSSLRAFYEDLTASGHSQNVLSMTFSEFGRTIFENGSFGTDHGTGAPMILIGEGIGSALHGTAPDLLSTDPFGDPLFSTDFRQTYASVLRDWMCVSEEVTDFVFGNQHFEPIQGLLPPSSPPFGPNNPAALLGHNPSPTPGHIQIKYGLKIRGNVRLQILDTAGHPLRTLLNEFKERGSYTFELNPAAFFLPPGEYIYRLDTAGKVQTRQIRW